MGCLLDLFLFPVRVVYSFFFGSWQVLAEMQYLGFRVHRLEECFTLFLERYTREEPGQRPTSTPTAGPGLGDALGDRQAWPKPGTAYDDFLRRDH